MDKSRHQQVIDARIQALVESLLPNGSGLMSAHRLETALRNVADVAFREGENYALLSLMTVEQVAAELGISERRVRAIAKIRHDQLGIGWRVPGTNTWLFRPEEVELLRPGRPGRPRTNRS